MRTQFHYAVLLSLATLAGSPAWAWQATDGASTDGATSTAPVDVPIAPVPADQDPFELFFELRTPGDTAVRLPEVDLDLPSGVVTIPLVDDGSVPGDCARDGIYKGGWRGTYLRWAYVRLRVHGPGDMQLTSDGLERFEDRHSVQLAWRLFATPQGLVVARTAARPRVGIDAPAGALELVASFGWAALLAVGLVTLALQVRRART